MRKKYLLLLFLIIGFGIAAYVQYHDSTFVEKNFKLYTEVNDYFVITSYFDNSDSYIETVISNSNKRILLKKFKFENNLLKLKGRVEPSFITENSNYIYHIIEKGYGPYGYILFALEKGGNTLIVYEHYGN